MDVTHTHDELLPAPPRSGRAWLKRNGLVVDIAFMVTYFLAQGLLLLAATGLAGPNEYRDTILLAPRLEGISEPAKNVLAIVAVVAVILVGLSGIWRRKHPFLALTLVSLAAFLPIGVAIAALAVVQMVLLWAVAVHDSVKRAWVGLVIVLISGTASVFFNLNGPFDAFRDVVFPIIMSVAISFAVLLWGINVGNHERYIAALQDRARQLAIERDQRAQLAVADERARIAREMHDIVAHSLSVMITLSEGASRAVQSAPEQASDAMRSSAEAGRSALADMRRALGVLRADNSAELAPQPGIADLPELVRGFREAGLEVSLETDTQVQDPALEMTVYRVVQEGLTNSLRYAGMRARAEVRVAEAGGALSVSVRDYGVAPGMPKPPASQGSEQGLIGVRERVRAFGGTMQAGRAADGTGFELQAKIPVRSDRDR